VKEYSNWQQSKIHDEILKVEFRKTCDFTLADRLDLVLIHVDQDQVFSLRKALKEALPGGL
jgi:hypothetical protein